jgi:Cell division control protein 14, SIN component
MKLVEFLYFYLMPETPQILPQTSASATNTAVLGGRGRELVAAFERNRRETIGGVEKAGCDPSKTRTTEDKQKMLGKYLGNVDDLVEDLREGGGPFAGGAF